MLSQKTFWKPAELYVSILLPMAEAMVFGSRVSAAAAGSSVGAGAGRGGLSGNWIGKGEEWWQGGHGRGGSGVHAVYRILSLLFGGHPPLSSKSGGVCVETHWWPQVSIKHANVLYLPPVSTWVMPLPHGIKHKPFRHSCVINGGEEWIGFDCQKAP